MVCEGYAAHVRHVALCTNFGPYAWVSMLGVLWWTGGALGIFLSRNNQVCCVSLSLNTNLTRFIEKCCSGIDVRVKVCPFQHANEPESALY